MEQTLWISLPQPQINALKELFEYIKIKKLPSINSNQLAEKFKPSIMDRNWLGLFAKYNKIHNVNKIPINQLFSLPIGLITKLKNCNSNLSFKSFQPNELLSLLIIYHIDENFIDSNLCKAVTKNNLISIKKEILEKENPSLGRISEINTYLLIYALYANDYCVKLPQNIVVNIRLYAKQNHIFLVEIDNQIRNARSPTYAYPPVLENYLYNSKLIEADKLAALPNKTNVNIILISNL